MDDHDDDPDDGLFEAAEISDARERATLAAMLLQHPKMKAVPDMGLYATAMEQAKLVLKLVDQTETCSSAQEFDVLLNLVCCQADCLAETLSLLRIP